MVAGSSDAPSQPALFSGVLQISRDYYCNSQRITSVIYIIDLGPDGGEAGGRMVVAAGTPEDIAAKHKESYTGQYLDKLLQKHTGGGSGGGK